MTPATGASNFSTSKNSANLVVVVDTFDTPTHHPDDNHPPRGKPTKMPPHLPRPSSLRSLLTTTTKTCTPSTLRTIVTIPPESPHYIRVPEPKQKTDPPPPRIRGHLPVPREIFPHRTSGRRLTSHAYIAKTAPRSQAEVRGRFPWGATAAQKRRDAAMRRRALSVGLRLLWQRKRKADAKAAQLSRIQGAANRRAALAPDALDDVLTRGTVRLSTAATTAVVADPLRFERAEAARERHAGIMGAKAEARRDALAQLYVAASEFIVDEAELVERVARLFDPEHHAYQKTQAGQNIWTAQGVPISVVQTRREAADLLKTKVPPASRTVNRQKKVAEELTGGKL